MSMAAAAAAGARHSRLGGSAPSHVYLSAADKRRIKAEVEAHMRRARYKGLLKKYDTDKSGKLSKDQMMKLLTDLDTSTPEGTPPTEEELNFIIAAADTTGSFLGFSDGEIDADEIECAVVNWLTYVDHRSEIDANFEKYDKDKTGQIEKGELKAYLTSLNGNSEVTDEEVDWVLKMSDLSGTGRLNKPELLRATLEWFTYVKEGKPSQSCCLVL